VDRIIINDLAVACRVGVSESERLQPQTLRITVELSGDFTAAAATDDLRQTIDYYAVAQRLLRFGEGRQWRLLEKLAVDIAAMILAEFKPQSVSVSIKKYVIAEAAYVGVAITRPLLADTRERHE